MRKLQIFLLLLNQFSYKAHIWYVGTSHQYISGGTKVKVICQGHVLERWSSQGHSCFTKRILFYFNLLEKIWQEKNNLCFTRGMFFLQF